VTRIKIDCESNLDILKFSTLGVNRGLITALSILNRNFRKEVLGAKGI
jgi:hypothetical protein